jgi:hypothetical protein
MLCRDCIHNRPALDMTQRPACTQGRDAEVVQGYGCDQWDDGVTKPKADDDGAVSPKVRK